MPKKRLSINLADRASVQNSINLVRNAKYKVIDAHNKMIVALTEELVDVIKINANAMLGTSWAEESIHATYVTNDDGRYIGQIWGADYLVYIEYGTGNLDGEQLNPDMPSGYHPETKHTVNINGTNYEKDYWVYYDDRVGFVTTEGQAPRPFIRQSVEQVKKHAKKKAEVTFYEWIAST